MQNNYEVTPSQKHSFLVANSSINGKGLFATKKIPQGIIFLEYKGKVLTEKEANEVENENYIFILPNGTYIDGNPSLFENIAGFINHSCNPNVDVVWNYDLNRVLFVTLRDIKKGEELVFDYWYPVEEDEKKTPCTCGAKNCRKFIERQ